MRPRGGMRAERVAGASPCPFCGHDDIWLRHSGQAPPHWGTMSCRACNGEGPRIAGEDPSLAAAALLAWNSRGSLDPALGPLLGASGCRARHVVECPFCSSKEIVFETPAGKHWSPIGRYPKDAILIASYGCAGCGAGSTAMNDPERVLLRWNTRTFVKAAD